MRTTHGQTVQLEAVNAALEAAHGLNTELHAPFAQLSVPGTTPFDYMFPELQGSTEALLPEDEHTVENLKRLGRVMSEAQDTTQRDSAIPAAYTYFGQFLDHEITFEAISGSVARLNDPQLAPLPLETIREKIVNGRSPRLDLDCVYGPQPDGGPIPRDGARLTLGRVFPSGGRPPGKDDLNDLPRKPPSTASLAEDREALIGDARNDENLIVAQLHVAFLRAHNALIAGGSSFNQAKLALSQHFQWLVIHDFLKRIANPEIVNEILTRGHNRFYTPPAGQIFMPLEFSAAAYRFGHSMVRKIYNYNLNFQEATLGELFTLTAFSGNINPIPGQGFPTLPENWIIEWEDFLDGGRNPARRIDTYLTEPLFALRDFAGQPLPDEAILSVRNLLRAYLLRIPTGQAVAKHLGLTPLTASEIEAAAGEEQAQVLRETGFSTHTPLWYYILAESARHLPDHLGPVGSTIIAEVLIELVRRSEDSILTQANWRPTLGAAPGRFTLHDLLRLAGVLNQPDSGSGIEQRPIKQSKLQGAQPISIIAKVEQTKMHLMKNPDEAEENAKRAIAAIQAGIHSRAWEIYMTQFAENTEQLRRLKATDGTLGDPSLDRRRAYLVSNAVCGKLTTNDFDMEVNTIDVGLGGGS